MSDTLLDSQIMRRRRGAVLKAARQAAGLSARKLVDRINARTPGSDLTDHAIYAYEAGRVLLSREVAERVAVVLKMPVGELLVGDPDFRTSPPPPEVSTPDTAHPEVSHPEAAPPAAAAPDTAHRRLTPPYTADPDHTDAHANADAAVLLRDLDPSQLHHLLAVRESVLDRGSRIVPAVETLIRQLVLPRFTLPSPQVFAASFELCAADLRGLLDAPEAAWIKRQNDDAPHAPLRELLEHAQAMSDALATGFADLQQQTRTQNDCAAAAADLHPPLSAALDELVTTLGRVRRLAPHH